MIDNFRSHSGYKYSCAQYVRWLFSFSFFLDNIIRQQTTRGHGNDHLTRKRRRRKHNSSNQYKNIQETLLYGHKTSSQYLWVILLFIYLFSFFFIIIFLIRFTCIITHFNTDYTFFFWNVKLIIISSACRFQYSNNCQIVQCDVEL